MEIDVDKFLATGDQFRLGCLDTEACHPLTENLQRLSVDNLPEAVARMKAVDVNALRQMRKWVIQLEKMAEDVRAVLEAGNMVYIFGCGSTGRLAVAVEHLAKRENFPYANQITGFLSGGDCAIVKSIEQFEDHSDYGAQQLVDIGFTKNDLLLASSEGGETPIVIGCVEAAARMSMHKPYFLYCNPTPLLIDKIDRSRRVIENKNVNKLCMAIGPMALSGSTRMQASTVLMLAFALTLKGKLIGKRLKRIIDIYEKLDLSFLTDFISAEHRIYESGGELTYLASDHAFTVSTDLTERSPTFSLAPFERYPRVPNENRCIAYLAVKGTNSPQEAWNYLLGRRPNCIEWSHTRDKTGEAALDRFNISEDVIKLRSQEVPQNIFEIYNDNKGMVVFRLNENYAKVNLGSDLLEQTIILKMVINMHSTLVMGRLRRYQSNVMTYVATTNYKLVDRAVRYVVEICKTEHGRRVQYEDALRALGRCSASNGDSSVVLRTVDGILRGDRLADPNCAIAEGVIETDL